MNFLETIDMKSEIEKMMAISMNPEAMSATRSRKVAKSAKHGRPSHAGSKYKKSLKGSSLPKPRWMQKKRKYGSQTAADEVASSPCSQWAQAQDAAPQHQVSWFQGATAQSFVLQPQPSCFQGFQGSQGFQGFQGSQGFQGFQGFQGCQGFQGFQAQAAAPETHHSWFQVAPNQSEVPPTLDE
ncbi:uncharacterized protein LOC108021933 isoform X3 [Drosophila biarmipes]|uniref:uncharacterized protein LOC108021933 isoform X3 n=1 Tax=Drosophila biarmipes TaxID=125945 RepID=UPI0021CC7A5E|nr:uncharacterized protein LOC108021933 isoform X3 [Drosophila biarmipes]